MLQPVDPSSALEAFQRDFRHGRLPWQRGALDQNLYVVWDEPNGRPRFTYFTVDSGAINAIAMLVLVGQKQDRPTFQLGVAVPKALQGQGRAKHIVRTAINELKHGLASANVMAFDVEAVVETDNIASQKVAAACLSQSPTDIVDKFSGKPALHYVMNVTSTTPATT